MEVQNKPGDNTKKPDQLPKITRRRFLTNTGLLVGGAALFTAASGTLFYSAALENKKNGKTAQKQSNNLVYLGDQSAFEDLSEVTEVKYKTEIEDGWVKQQVEGMVYVIKDSNNEMLIMSPVCTHLGCTVPFASEEKGQTEDKVVFRCPCHGGEFDQFGINVGGPPPRPLDIYEPIIQDNKVYFDYFSPIQRKT